MGLTRNQIMMLFQQQPRARGLRLRNLDSGRVIVEVTADGTCKVESYRSSSVEVSHRNIDTLLAEADGGAWVADDAVIPEE
jgi:hypothetical protein